jgi:hypothetical protein
LVASSYVIREVTICVYFSEIICQSKFSYPWQPCIFGKLFLKIIVAQKQAGSIRYLPLSWCAPTKPVNVSVIMSLIASWLVAIEAQPHPMVSTKTSEPRYRFREIGGTLIRDR